MGKFMLSEEDYEYVGAFFENIIFTFAAGGVIGMISGLIYSIYKKFKKKEIM